MKKPVVYVAIMGLAVLSGYAGYMYQAGRAASEGKVAPVAATAEAPEEQTAVEIMGRPRPDFSMQDVNGRMRHIDEWDGQVVAINFWATWCPPCLKEIPEFIRLQDKYTERGLQFLGIALQRPEEVMEFIAEKAINYPVMAGELEVVDLARAYGNDIGALPYTVIIDRQGIVAFVKHGELSGEEAEEVITRLL